MDNRRAKSNYQPIGLSDLFTVSKTVGTSMTDNDNFPAPEPPPADFLKTVAAYGDAVEAAKTRDVRDIARRNALRQQVLKGLNAYALYVNFMAQGDVTKLLSSSLAITRERVPTVVTRPVIQVSQGTVMGSMLVRVVDCKGAKSYGFQYAEIASGNLAWTTVTGSLKTMQITGLKEGGQYWFRVVAVGSYNREFTGEAVPAFVNQHVASNVA